jgi:hypothetical protein
MKFVLAFVLFVATLVLLGIAAIFAGTLVWLMWPVVIPAVFPGLVISGVIAGKVSWWACVCLTWLMGILVKSTQTTVNKS